MVKMFRIGQSAAKLLRSFGIRRRFDGHRKASGDEPSRVEPPSHWEEEMGSIRPRDGEDGDMTWAHLVTVGGCLSAPGIVGDDLGQTGL